MKLQNCVYRFLNKNNEVIYIGKAKDLKNRLNGHTHLPKECYEERVKVEFVNFETEDDMDFAERYYIPKYKPKYNTMMNERMLSININEFDNAVWQDIKNTNKKFERKDVKKENRDVCRDSYLELLKELHIQNEIKKQKEFEENIHKKVVCTSTGEVFSNILEYKEYMNTSYDTELLIESAKNNVFLNIKHPIYYNVNCVPTFLEIYEAYSEEQKENIKNYQRKNTRKIVCITTGEVFCNIYQAQDKYKLNVVHRCCDGDSNYHGEKDSKPLVWKWYDEYSNMTKEEIDAYIDKAYSVYNKRNLHKSKIN